jgi:histidinol dehydrogenase
MLNIYNYNDENCTAFINDMLNKMDADYTEQQRTVDEIIANVRAHGDAAVFEYTRKFTGVTLTSGNVRVTEEEIDEAVAEVGADFMDVLKLSAERILDFHLRQKRQSWFTTENEGEILGQIIRPLDVAGVYAPCGTAPYPSSVLMTVLPAKAAGVNRIIMCSPAAADGKVSAVILAAARVSGADEIYKLGGAQAIAAMAYGTETVPRVDKICGPGSIFVALAKKSVFGQVDIDSIAGPSDILVIADETADPVFLAADLLSQAEHDELASSILVTTSSVTAEKTQAEIIRQLQRLPRKEIARQSLNRYGAIIITENLRLAASVSNLLAPEHLELCVAEPFALLPLITNAGAIFMGNYTPESLGDYTAGTNHVLPTGGTSRFFSSLSVDSFVKKSSVLYFTKDACLRLADATIKFAEAEGFDAHAEAVRVRKNV